MIYSYHDIYHTVTYQTLICHAEILLTERTAINLNFSTYFIFIVVFIIIAMSVRQRRTAAAVHLHHIRKKKGKIIMTELVKKFIGKECIIYTMNSSAEQISGTIGEIDGEWITVENMNGGQEIVNLEYVTRIREYPRNKNGKKKSVVLD